MIRLLKFSLFVLSLLIWSLSFFILCWTVTTQEEILALIAIGTITITGLLYWQNTLFQRHSNLGKKRLLQGILNHLTPSQELIVFDDGDKIVWQSHPHFYANLKDFFHKTMLRIADSPQMDRLKKILEAREESTLILECGGDGLGEGKEWIQIETKELQYTKNSRQQHYIVTLQNITNHYEPLYKLRKNYNVLEQFLDKAPFGLYYTNPQKHVIALNQTLADWLGMEKKEVLGENVSYLIDYNPVQKMAVLKGSRKKDNSRYLLITTDDEKNRANLLCKVQSKDVYNISGDSPIDQEFFDAAIPSVILTKEGQITSFNQAFGEMLTNVGEPLPEKNTTEANFTFSLSPSIRSEVMTKIRRAFENDNNITPFEVKFLDNKIQATAYLSRLRDTVNEVGHVMLQFIDNSEQKKLEQQFIQSQKMQAVGQLAGGVAHDFNNLLTAMIGFCDLLLHRHLPNDPSYTDVMQIKQNANRAANLVRQLLAFSRQQTLQPKIINITDTLAELSALLQRLIGASIDFKVIHARDLWNVKVDGSQLEQVIINLVVNARDAISTIDGKNDGQILIQTHNQTLTKPELHQPETIPPGEYVVIEVKDNGHGIAKEHIEYIFEPFFSTKEVGSGTGLGLATVFGIVKQTGGFISVVSDSQEDSYGQGTSFYVYLPKYVGKDVEETNGKEPQSHHDLTGSETILLVEDEDAVRMFSARALREKGYRVIEASSGEEALDYLNQVNSHCDLLITDVVMPKIDGPTLSKKVRDRWPDLATIFISGYTEDTFRKNLDDNSKIHFLSKPFSLKDLAVKVKEVIVKS